MKSLSFWAIAIFACLNIGCYDNESTVLNKVDNAFRQSLKHVTNNPPQPASLYLVIPRAGCSGCISSAEEFMLDCINDSSKRRHINFVLTNFDSEKIIRARFGDYINNNPTKILIDKSDVFTENTSLKSMYPQVYFYDKEGKLSKVSEVSPNHDGLSDATNYLAVNKGR